MDALVERGVCERVRLAGDGGPVELHHSTLHVKPPETGHPFPMHQDWAFYKHVDGRYVDVLVHLDDTRHENGEIRFLAGSHKQGALEHALDLLERAVDMGWGDRAWMENDSDLESLHPEPRFQALLSRIH